MNKQFLNEVIFLEIELVNLKPIERYIYTLIESIDKDNEISVKKNE